MFHMLACSDFNFQGSVYFVTALCVCNICVCLCALCLCVCMHVCVCICVRSVCVCACALCWELGMSREVCTQHKHIAERTQKWAEL